MKKIKIREVPSKVLNLLHPSSVTWLSAGETAKRTGVILAVVSSAFMVVADTAFGALLKLVV